MAHGLRAALARSPQLALRLLHVRSLSHSELQPHLWRENKCGTAIQYLLLERERAVFKALRRNVPPLELHGDVESGVFSDGGLQAMFIVSLRKSRKPPS